MGDRFRKQQIKNFQKGREIAYQVASEPRLIDRPEVTKIIYHVQTDDGKDCVPGENVRALLPDPTGPVVVVRDYVRIGIIDGEGGEILKKALAEPSGPSIGELRILAVEGISGEARAEMVGSHVQ
jgi:hypothetical protein